MALRDFTDDLRALRRRMVEAEVYLDVETSRKRMGELEADMSRPDLWDDTEVGQRLTREFGQVRGDVELLDGLEGRISDAETLYELSQEEDDDSVGPELEGLVAALSGELDRLEVRSLFTGPHDERDAVCEIHAKDGGTDAQDWAEMLLRMYQRWAERRGFDVELDEISAGSEAGILSATFIVRGRHATGLLASERGVHRLVRISPFDSQARRQTSFASVTVVPFLEDFSDEVDIEEKDLRIDTYRSSGAGGPACERDRLGGAHHPPAHRGGGLLPERAQPAPKQGQGHADLGGQAGRAPAGGAGRRDQRHGWSQGAGRLGCPDPLLRSRPIPAGQGPAHRLRGGQRKRCPRWRLGRLHGGVPALASSAGHRLGPREAAPQVRATPCRRPPTILLGTAPLELSRRPARRQASQRSAVGSMQLPSPL